VLLELYYWEEMSHAELAESYEITPASVRARLYRARNALRKQLQADAEQTGAASFRMGELDDLDSWARQVQAHSPLAS
jgi:RNA polymerase sigma-70 factor (ECF subfamily)